jgi:pre-mRNA-splicing factor 38B
LPLQVGLFAFLKVELLNLKAYSEVVDEIYYKVSHLEPWERGTRKTAGMSKFCFTYLSYN